MNDNINVLSLFDGMSCGQIALERAGLSVNKYYASELDKYAIKVTQANYPDTIQLGDVRGVDPEKLDKIDLVIGGSPCQGFSFSGKQLAFDDPRSALFFEYVRILERCKELNPNVKFLLENVRMKKEYLAVITKLLGVEPVLINSALVSAQNRQRYYWTNIAGVEQPVDKNIYLKNILEINANNSFTLENYSDRCKKQIKKNSKNINQKAIALCANSNVTGSGITCLEVKGGALRGRYLIDGKRQDHKGSTAGKTEQRLEIRKDKKTNTLTTVQKDNVVVRDKSKCVRSGGRGSFDRHEWDSISNCHYRKLTPIECERLQTVPDNYTNHVSNTQRYKMIGNGWTVDVITHIFKGLISEFSQNKSEAA